MDFHWADIVILVLLGLSVITGLIRGFMRELIAICVWVAAIWIAYAYAGEVSPKFSGLIKEENIRTAASFVGLMMATLVIGGIVSTALSFVLNKTPLKGTDRVFGMGFGLVRGAFIVAFLIGVVNLTSLTNEKDFNGSKLYLKFKPISEWMFSFAPKAIHDLKKKPDEEKHSEQSESPKQFFYEGADI